MHHPFTAPLYEDLGWLESAPWRVRGQHYDLVLNGVELGGGSIRIHDRACQEFIMRHVMKVSMRVDRCVLESRILLFSVRWKKEALLVLSIY